MIDCHSSQIHILQMVSSLELIIGVNLVLIPFLFIVTIRIKETFFVFCSRMCLLWHIQQIYANAF